MKSTTVRAATVLACGSLVLAGCGGSSGAGDGDGDYAASGTVRLVVSMAAGGGSDRAGRVMAEALNESDGGYNVVVENREGGGGAIGWSYIHGMAGQGDALVKAETAIHTLPLQEGVDVPWTYADFTPIAMFAEDSRMVVAPASAPYETCTDLLDAGPITSGVSGTFGVDGMVLAELEAAGMEAEEVPFGSTGEVVTGLLGGQIEVAPVSAAAAKQYVENGDFKALCTMSEEGFADDPVLSDVQTATEQGIDATVVIWRGIIGPPDMPEAAVEYWTEQFQAAVETDAYAEYIETDMLTPTQLYGDEFRAYLDDYDAQIQEYFGD